MTDTITAQEIIDRVYVGLRKQGRRSVRILNRRIDAVAVHFDLISPVGRL